MDSRRVSVDVYGEMYEGGVQGGEVDEEDPGVSREDEIQQFVLDLSAEGEDLFTNLPPKRRRRGRSLSSSYHNLNPEDTIEWKVKSKEYRNHLEIFQDQYPYVIPALNILFCVFLSLIGLIVIIIGQLLAVGPIKPLDGDPTPILYPDAVGNILLPVNVSFTNPISYRIDADALFSTVVSVSYHSSSLGVYITIGRNLGASYDESHNVDPNLSEYKFEKIMYVCSKAPIYVQFHALEDDFDENRPLSDVVLMTVERGRGCFTLSSSMVMAGLVIMLIAFLSSAITAFAMYRRIDELLLIANIYITSVTIYIRRILPISLK